MCVYIYIYIYIYKYIRCRSGVDAADRARGRGQSAADKSGYIVIIITIMYKENDIGKMIRIMIYIIFRLAATSNDNNQKKKKKNDSSNTHSNNKSNYNGCTQICVMSQQFQTCVVRFFFSNPSNIVLLQ